MILGAFLSCKARIAHILRVLLRRLQTCTMTTKRCCSNRQDTLAYTSVVLVLDCGIFTSPIVFVRIWVVWLAFFLKDC